MEALSQHVNACYFFAFIVVGIFQFVNLKSKDFPTQYDKRLKDLKNNVQKNLGHYGGNRQTQTKSLTETIEKVGKQKKVQPHS